MPATEVIYFAEQGISPFLEWLDQQQQERVQDKDFDAVARLEELGHELRRPEAEYLGDDLYELRVKRGHVNYRPLYFFDDVRDEKGGRIVRRRAVIVHGCIKEGKWAVPTSVWRRSAAEAFGQPEGTYVRTAVG